MTMHEKIEKKNFFTFQCAKKMFFLEHKLNCSAHGRHDEMNTGKKLDFFYFDYDIFDVNMLKLLFDLEQDFNDFQKSQVRISSP